MAKKIIQKEKLHIREEKLSKTLPTPNTSSDSKKSKK